MRGQAGDDSSERRTPGVRGVIVHVPELEEAMLGQVAELVHALNVSVVLLADRARIDQAVRAMKRGVAEFLEFPPGKDELLAAARRALEESSSRACDLVRREEIVERVRGLTPRERQILDLIVQGRTSREIAAALGISRRTVDSHRWKIARKLNAGNLAGLVRVAVLAQALGSEAVMGTPERSWGR